MEASEARLHEPWRDSISSSLNCRVQWDWECLCCGLHSSFFAWHECPWGRWPSLLEVAVKFIDFYLFSVDSGVGPRSPSS